MSDISIIHKTNENGKVPADDEQRWFAHVREYGIFNDAQARLIADALIDVQIRVRNDCQKEIDEQVRGFAEGLAEGMAECLMEKIGNLPDEVSVLRERVATLEGQIKAITDLRGIPGARGERGARGEQGKPGIQGLRGGAGPRGMAAPHWIGVKIEGFDLITVLSDGTVGPRISLKQMFEEFAIKQALAGT
jgi:hypothetical protein